MPRTRPAYPPEFRQEMIELVHSGRSPESLAKVVLTRNEVHSVLDQPAGTKRLIACLLDAAGLGLMKCLAFPGSIRKAEAVEEDGRGGCGSWGFLPIGHILGVLQGFPGSICGGDFPHGTGDPASRGGTDSGRGNASLQQPQTSRFSGTFPEVELGVYLARLRRVGTTAARDC